MPASYGKRARRQAGPARWARHSSPNNLHGCRWEVCREWARGRRWGLCFATCGLHNGQLGAFSSACTSHRNSGSRELNGTGEQPGPGDDNACPTLTRATHSTRGRWRRHDYGRARGPADRCRRPCHGHRRRTRPCPAPASCTRSPAELAVRRGRKVGLDVSRAENPHTGAPDHRRNWSTNQSSAHLEGAR